MADDPLISPDIKVTVPPSLIKKLNRINAPKEEIKSTTLEAVLTVQGDLPPYMAMGFLLAVQ